VPGHLRHMTTSRIATLAAAAALLAGCGSSSDNSSSNNTTPQASTSPTATNAQTASGALDARDKDFVIKTQQGALFEIQAGKLGLKNASTPQGKKFAKRMIKDHSGEAAALSKLAGKLHVSLPPKPDNTEIKEIQTISKYHGKRFDTAYLRLEIADHRDDIAGAHKETSEGVNQQVVTFARRYTVTYRTHLKLAVASQQAVGGQT
jgi:putative membrane protein